MMSTVPFLSISQKVVATCLLSSFLSWSISIRSTLPSVTPGPATLAQSLFIGVPVTTTDGIIVGVPETPVSVGGSVGDAPAKVVGTGPAVVLATGEIGGLPGGVPVKTEQHVALLAQVHPGGTHLPRPPPIGGYRHIRPDAQRSGVPLVPIPHVIPQLRLKLDCANRTGSFAEDGFALVRTIAERSKNISKKEENNIFLI